jgi:hypothetical protein
MFCFNSAAFGKRVFGIRAPGVFRLPLLPCIRFFTWEEFIKSGIYRMLSPETAPSALKNVYIRHCSDCSEPYVELDYATLLYNR